MKNRISIPSKTFGILRVSVLAGLTLLMAGCEKGRGDLINELELIRARPGRPIDPLPEIKQFEQFNYEAHDLRDPFAPFLDATSAGDGGLKPPEDHVKEELEYFPLDGLDMVGTMAKGGAEYGLVKDPDGVVHRVRAGNYLGQNLGKILAVYEDRIELVELVPNGAGGWMEKPATLALESE